MRYSPFFAAAAFLAAPSIAQQAQPVELKIETFAVKSVKQPNGTVKNEFVAPTMVTPGTPLVVAVKYTNKGRTPVSGMVVNYPIPKGVRYTGLGVNSEWGVVSIDGGKTFGLLSTLKARNPDASTRPASVDDVTNVRWAFTKPIAPGTAGTVMAYAQVK